MSSSIERFYREKPIKSFNVYQTMYSMIKEESRSDLGLIATSFLGSTMTYGQLFLEADKLAKSFYDAGIREGDTVAIITISMPIVQECLLSLSKIGATMAFIDLRTKESDLINYINNSNCKIVVIFDGITKTLEKIINETNIEKVIVCSPKDYFNPIMRVIANIKEIKSKQKMNIPSDKRFIRIGEFISQASDVGILSPVEFNIDRPSLIVQSSGSTGKPKQIVHTEYNFNMAVQKMAYTDLPFYKGSIMHISIPPFIIYGLGNSIYGSLAFTMNAFMTPYVSENTVYEDLGKFDIALAAPLHYRYIYEQLLKLQDEIRILEQEHNVRELKSKYRELKRIINGLKRTSALISGGDKISAEELLQMERLFEQQIINGYGNNESLGASIVSPMFANKPGSIGIPMYNTDIKIVNPLTGEEVKHGEVGELYISSDNIFKYYLNNPTETKKIKIVDENGKEWIKTGDLCYVDEDGFVIHKGRNRRLICKEAFKISPDTIEEVICNLEFVRDCVVVGVDDEKAQSVPMAFIELIAGVNFMDVLETIKHACAQELPDYEIPSYYRQIDKIPYTPNNKQDFRKLEELGNKIVKELNGKKLIKK